MVIIFTLLEQR